MKETKIVILRTSYKSTYNGLRCTAYVNDIADRSCGASGYGYSMEGTAIAQTLEKYTPILERCKKLTANYGSMDDTKGLYGLCFVGKETRGNRNKYKTGDEVYLSGACGESSMICIANACKIKVDRQGYGKNGNTYIIWRFA